MKITVRAAERLTALRRALDEEGEAARQLVACVDGGYTNRTVFGSIPPRTALIGRVRKDAKLYDPPAAVGGEGRRGRRRYYGRPLPSPEAYRQDPAVPWQQVKAFAAGKVFDFDVKTTGPVRWRGAGERDLRLVIIRPLAYRPTQGSRLLYREPSYLICSDPAMSLEQILQAYVWRWEIEVNFRDQKTLLGTGHAQVRNAASVERVPQLIACAYGFLHLAAHRLRSQNALPRLERPRWQSRTARSDRRLSSQEAISLLRADLWGQAIGSVNLEGFDPKARALAKSVFLTTNPASAIIYATN